MIPELVHRELDSIQLNPPRRTLRGPSQDILPVRGWFTGILNANGQETREDIYVVSDLHKPLLGRPAISALGLLKRVQAIEWCIGANNPEDLFPKLFQGLGKTQGEYKIKLKEGATPFSLTTPRRVAIPLMKPVKAELDRMQELGVITPIQDPTEWCAGMVVVPKPDGKVRICVDLTKLNENVCRELHPLPIVEQTLAQISGAQIFSKLDANLGFWQVPLSRESALLTSFITPFGRYYFNRLPFGITSAPEHFQRRMTAMLGNMEGTVCLMDDILGYRKTKEEHDRRLYMVLDRLQASGITLNKKKCVFGKTEVKFLATL